MHEALRRFDHFMFDVRWAMPPRREDI